MQIRASDSDVSHREEITTSDGSEMTVILRATFDGEDYEVNGSPLMDAIAPVLVHHTSNPSAREINRRRHP